VSLISHFYAAFAKDGDNESYDAPTFTDAVRLRRLIILISNAASAGDQQTKKLFLRKKWRIF
jgi:hypothetical protein